MSERPLLDRFVERFLARNALMNLSAARDAAAVNEHVDDALTVVPYVREPFVDVGSGGGFPGIPLAIVTGHSTTLVESTVKKARFLEETARALGLANVAVLAERAETVARDPRYRGTFASATARAVSSAPTVLELTIPLLKVGGIAILQRGALAEAERRALHDASLVLGAEVIDEIPAGTAPQDRRRIVLVRKHTETSHRFPRRAGVPAKRPLCYAVTSDA